MRAWAVTVAGSSQRVVGAGAGGEEVARAAWAVVVSPNCRAERRSSSQVVRTPFSMRARRRLATPSPSKGLERRPRRLCGSSMILIPSGKMRWPSLSLRKLVPRAIEGPEMARGTSFLKDKLGQRIFPEGINIIDDPHKRRGLRSKPFDGEGVANRRRALIENGVLTTWLLDLRSARQLGLTTTGHAARGTSSPPAPPPP